MMRTRREIYSQTREEGQPKDRALQRVGQFNYAIKRGLTSDRAREFAMSLQFKDAPARQVSDAEFKGLEDQGLVKADERHWWQALEHDPLSIKSGTDAVFNQLMPRDVFARKYAESYKYAIEHGMAQQDADEYAAAPATDQGKLRLEHAAGQKVKGLAERLGLKGLYERVSDSNVLGTSDKAMRDMEFSNQYRGSLEDQHIGKWLGRADTAVWHILEGFTNAQNVGIIGATEGLGTVAEGGILAHEAGEGSKLGRLSYKIGQTAGRNLPEHISPEEATAAADRGLKALKAIQEARVPVKAQKVARTAQEALHIGFTLQMAQGLGQGLQQGAQAAVQGDTAGMETAFIQALVNGLIVGTGVHDSVAQGRVRRDLDSKTREVYGTQATTGIAPPPPATANTGTGIAPPPVPGEVTQVGPFDVRPAPKGVASDEEITTWAKRRLEEMQPSAQDIADFKTRSKEQIEEGDFLRKNVGNADALRTRYGFEDQESADWKAGVIREHKNFNAEKQAEAIRKATAEGKKDLADRPKGNPGITQFSQLDDYQQAVVLNKLTEDSPEYQKALFEGGKTLENFKKQIKTKVERAGREVYNHGALQSNTNRYKVNSYAQAVFQKDFADLTPEQKGQVVYEAQKSNPNIQAQAKEQGYESPKTVSFGMNERLQQAIAYEQEQQKQNQGLFVAAGMSLDPTDAEILNYAKNRLAELEAKGVSKPAGLTTDENGNPVRTAATQGKLSTAERQERDVLRTNATNVAGLREIYFKLNLRERPMVTGIKPPPAASFDPKTGKTGANPAEVAQTLASVTQAQRAQAGDEASREQERSAREAEGLPTGKGSPELPNLAYSKQSPNDRPVEIDLPVLSDADRERLRREPQKDALSRIEDESARRARSSQDPFEHVDRRAPMVDRKQILAEIDQTPPEELTPDQASYRDLTAQLDQMAALLTGPSERAPLAEIKFGRLRMRLANAGELTPEEQGFMRLYAERERYKPKQEAVSEAQIATMESMAEAGQRAADLARGAADLRSHAAEGESAEDADLLSKKAAHSAELANRNLADQQHDASELQNPGLPFEVGTPVALRTGSATGIAVVGVAEPFRAHYGTMRLRDLKGRTLGKSPIPAGEFDPRFMLSADPSARTGPLVVLRDGTIVGSQTPLDMLNSALLSSAREDVLAEIDNNISRFGLATEGVDASNPTIPVRILDADPISIEDLARLRDDMARKTALPAEPMPPVIATQVKPAELDDVTAKMASSDMTLRELIATPYGSELLDRLITEGAVASREGFVDEAGKVSEAGRSLLERIVLGRALGGPQADAANLSDAALTQVSPLLGALARITDGPPEWQIADYFRQALTDSDRIAAMAPVLDRIGNSTESNVDKFYHPEQFRRGKTMARPAQPHPVVESLVKMLASGKESALADYARALEGRKGQTAYSEFERNVASKVGVSIEPEDWGTISAATPAEKAARADQKVKDPPTAAARAQQDNPTAIPPDAAREKAVAELMNATFQGVVSPENIFAVFDTDDRFKGWTGDLTHFFGTVIPNAFGVDMTSFFKRTLAAIRFGKAAEYGGGGLRQERQFGRSPWYLKSQKLLADRMRGPMPGADVLRMLQNNGIKVEELKWTGLDVFLAGREKVTPKEVQDHLAENEVKIEEVVKGTGLEPTASQEQAVVDWAQANHPEDVDGIRQTMEFIRGGRTQAVGDLEFAGVPDQLLEPFRNYAQGAGGAKFGNYQEPGGEGYREVLFTLPYRPDGEPAYKHGIRPDNNFQSGHWPENNVLAHVRMNTRRTADGKLVLHLEEIQSDWHQKGRDKGYTGTEEEKRASFEKTTQLRHPASDIIREVDSNHLGFSSHARAMGEIADDDQWLDAHDLRKALTPEQVATIEAWRDAHKERQRLHTPGTPDAPFKKDWHEMVLRRMLHHAAENGYDALSWTGGDLQNKRYQLSQQVNDVTFDKTPSGMFQIYASPKHQEGEINLGVHAAEGLANVVGKELAQRIVDHPGQKHTFSGVELEVGGEGMKGFYDKILPDYLNRFGKRFGARVESVTEKAIEPTPDSGAPQGWGSVGGRKPGEELTFQSLPITDAMRTSLQSDGIPLFQGEGSPNGVTDFLNDGRAVITLFEGADVSTVVHEMFHVMRRYLNPDDLRILEDHANKQIHAQQGVTYERGHWPVEKEELLARLWEQYLATGNAPNNALKNVFNKLKTAMRQIYYAIRNKPNELPELSPLAIIPSGTKHVKDAQGHWARRENGDLVKVPRGQADIKLDNKSTYLTVNMSPQVKKLFDSWFKEVEGKRPEAEKQLTPPPDAITASKPWLMNAGPPRLGELLDQWEALNNDKKVLFREDKLAAKQLEIAKEYDRLEKTLKRPQKLAIAGDMAAAKEFYSERELYPEKFPIEPPPQIVEPEAVAAKPEAESEKADPVATRQDKAKQEEQAAMDAVLGVEDLEDYAWGDKQSKLADLNSHDRKIVERYLAAMHASVDAADESALTAPPAADEPSPKSEAAPASAASLFPEDVPPALSPVEDGRVPLSQLHLDPKRFQYKLHTNAAGVTNKLSGLRWDEHKSGVVWVWKDPADGKTYVVNGHHRVELARENGRKDIFARYMNAPNGEQARRIGAMQNLADNSGTAIDFAKLFRDTHMTREDLDNENISSGSVFAEKGLALANLSQTLFDEVVNGGMTIDRGVAIGENTSDEAEQEGIVEVIKRAELQGKTVTDRFVAELGRQAKRAKSGIEVQESLWGVEELRRNYLLEKTELGEYIRNHIRQLKTIHGKVGNTKIARLLTKGKTRIDVDQNRALRDEAAQAEQVYDALANKSGEIDGIIEAAAAPYRRANKADKQAIRTAAFHEVNEYIKKYLASGEEANVSGVSPDKGDRKAALSGDPLPGFESVAGERVDKSAEEQGDQLTRHMTRPPDSVNQATGALDKSELFRGTDAVDQAEMFQPTDGMGGLFQFAQAIEDRLPAFDVLTDQEREQSDLVSEDGNLQAHMSKARVKRFDTVAEAKDWLVEVAQGDRFDELFHGAQIRQVRDGEGNPNGALVLYAPKDAQRLFQSAPGRADHYRGIVDGLIRKWESNNDGLGFTPMERKDIAYQMKVLAYNAGTSLERLGVDLNSPSKPAGLISPPDQRTVPNRVESNFPKESPREPGQTTKPGGVAPDGDPRNRVAGGSDRVPEQRQGPGVDGRNGPTGRGGRDDGRSLPVREPGGDGPGGSRGAGGAGPETAKPRDLRLDPVAIEPPKRERGRALVEPDPWRWSMKEKKLPENLPAKTVNLADQIAVQLLANSGQQEIVESSISALEQFDGTVIATPPGTGKTYMTLAIAKHFENKLPFQLVVTKSRGIIDQSKGFRSVAATKFGMELRDLPSKGKMSDLEPGIYVTTYAQLLNRKDMHVRAWDLVMFDEAAEGRRWYSNEHSQGMAAKKVSDLARKAVYVSATPWHNALELGWMSKLGLWNPGEFDQWAAKQGASKGTPRRGGPVGKRKKETVWSRTGTDAATLIKIRKQLIERGQYVNQEINMDGHTSAFGMVSLSEHQSLQIAQIQAAFRQAERFYELSNPKQAKNMRALGVSFLKNHLERLMLPQAIDMARQAQKQGLQVAIFSENWIGQDAIYKALWKADAAMDGRLTKMLPLLPDVYEELAKGLGKENLVNFSGAFSSKRQAQGELFNEGKKPFMFATYGAGGVGMSFHDTSKGGVNPRMAIYLGPPWSGIMLHQAMGRLWRYGAESNVHSVFMMTNAKPHINMILSKIVPRLNSLHAAVSGIDGTNPLVQSMKKLPRAQQEAMQYELGGKYKPDLSDFQVDRGSVPIADWRQTMAQIPSAVNMRGKGIKLPGQTEKMPTQMNLLFQDGKLEGGPEGLPDRFLSPAEARAKLETAERMQDLEDGVAVPVLGEEARDIPPGDRKVLAEQLAPIIAEQGKVQVEADAAARAAQAAENGFTRIMAAVRANEIDAIENPKPGEPAWQMKSIAPPPDGEALDDNRAGIRAYSALISGMESVRAVTRQAGVAEIGEQIRENQRNYMAWKAQYAGEYIGQVTKLTRDLDLKPADWRVLWDLKEGQGVAPNARLAKGVEQLVKLLNDVREQAAAKGINLNDYDENGKPLAVPYASIKNKASYMPHIFNYDEKVRVKDPSTGKDEVFTLKQLLWGKDLPAIRKERIMAGIAEKTGWSLVDVSDWMDERRRQTALAGNMERARKADLPFYRKDEGALIQYLAGAGEVFARAEFHGQKGEKLNGLIARIPNREARKVVKEIMLNALAPQPWGDWASKWYGRVAMVEVTSKMIFSPIKVLGHLVHSGILLNQYGPMLKGIFATAVNFKDAKERAVFSGALAEQVKNQFDLAMASDMRVAHRFLKYTGFNALYTLDRIFANSTAKIWIEQYALPALIKGSKKGERYRTMLREHFLMGDKEIDAAIASKRWSQKDIDHAGVALANKMLFTSDPTELPYLMRARASEPLADNMLVTLRIATVLKSFTLKTATLLKQQLIDEAFKGNLRPWAPFLLAYPIIGQSLRLLSGGVQAVFQSPTSLQHQGQDIEEMFDDPTVGKFIKWWLDGVCAATALSMIAHPIDVMLFPPDNKRRAKFQRDNLPMDEIKEAVGPFSGLINIGQALAKMAEASRDAAVANTDEEQEKHLDELKRAIWEFGKEELPVARGTIQDIEEEGGLRKRAKAEMSAPPQ